MRVAQHEIRRARARRRSSAPASSGNRSAGRRRTAAAWRPAALPAPRDTAPSTRGPGTPPRAKGSLRAVDRLAGRDDAGDACPSPAPTRALVVLTQAGSASSNMAGSSSHGSRFGSQKARGEGGRQQRRARAGGAREQLVDEAILAAPQRRSRRAGQLQEVGRIVPPGMRRGEHQRRGLLRRAQRSGTARGAASAAAGEASDGPWRIQAALARSVTCLARAAAVRSKGACRAAPADGRVAQRESIALTRRGSQVQSLSRPPSVTIARRNSSNAAGPWPPGSRCGRREHVALGARRLPRRASRTRPCRPASPPAAARPGNARHRHRDPGRRARQSAFRHRRRDRSLTAPCARSASPGTPSIAVLAALE